MAFPDIRFNNGTGSDTAASGAGPSTALTGSNATWGATTITLDGSPDLTNVATDGSHAIYIDATTGRRWCIITAKDNTAKTVTVGNAPGGTSGRAWAIGGKRQTIGAASSRLLFSADMLSGWSATLEDDQPALTSTLRCDTSGSTTGMITLRGDSALLANRRLITSATNNVPLLSGGLQNWHIENLKFESTAGTKTTSYGVNYDANGNAEFTMFHNCTFGHATNKLQKAINRDGTSQRSFSMLGCIVQHTLGIGIGNSGGGATQGFRIIGCDIHDCGAEGINLDFGGLADLCVEECTIWNNTFAGIYMPNSGSQGLRLVVRNCTIHNNADGIVIEHARNLLGAEFFNNQFTGNTGWGIDFNGSNGDQLVAFCDFNNYGTGALANGSGSLSGLSGGANDKALDPGYTNDATGDFTIGTATAASGWPSTIGQI